MLHLRFRAAALLLLTLCLWPLPAFTNSAHPSHMPGDRTGVIIPRQNTSIRVDHEVLSFDLADDLRSARVKAVYTMSNGTEAAADTEMAFIFVDRGRDSSTAPDVTVDGAPVPFQVVTDAELLAPQVEAWMGAHPEITAEMARLASDRDWYRPNHMGRISRLLSDAGIRPDQPTVGRLLSYQRGEPNRLTATLLVASVVIPEKVAELYRGWSPSLMEKKGYGPTTWLFFRVPFGPQAVRNVSVAYTHRAEVDGTRRHSPSYRYEYLLTPARSWAGFGPLEISVKVPGETSFTANLPLTRTRDGAGYSARLPGLPDRELDFTVRSTRGLILGLEPPEVQWYGQLGLMAAFGGLLGWVLGVRCTRAGTESRLAGVVVAFALSLPSSLLFLWLLWQVWPSSLHQGLGIIEWYGKGALLATAVCVAVTCLGLWAKRNKGPVASNPELRR